MTTVMADTVRQLTCAMFCAPVLERFLLKFPNTISHHTVNKLYNPHLYGEWGGVRGDSHTAEPLRASLLFKGHPMDLQKRTAQSQMAKLEMMLGKLRTT